MKFFGNIFIFIFVSVIYWLFANNFSFLSIAPNILFTSAISLAILLNPVIALTFCFFWGLYADMMGVNAFGAYALIYTLLCYAVHLSKKHFDFDMPIPQIALIFILSVLSFLFYQLLSLIFLNISPLPLKNLFIEPFINSILMPFVFAIFYYAQRKLKIL
ncbi:MAG: rod shape-determining protein MreD [Elusimicrobiota bacterium]|nr:rod shape-determining protein MreD [Elusimicrobiota bacterium]